MGGFQLMQILGLLGMDFDAAVVFVTNSSLLFRFAVAILLCLCRVPSACPQAVISKSSRGRQAVVGQA